MQKRLLNGSESASEPAMPHSALDVEAEEASFMPATSKQASSAECLLTDNQHKEMVHEMNNGVGVCDAFRRAYANCNPISRWALHTFINK